MAASVSSESVESAGAITVEQLLSQLRERLPLREKPVQVKRRVDSSVKEDDTAMATSSIASEPTSTAIVCINDPAMDMGVAEVALEASSTEDKASDDSTSPDDVTLVV
jgi:hypothetical protein